MTKTKIIGLISTILCFVVLTTTFALYRRDAETKEIVLSFGEIAELNIGDITSSGENISPDNASGSFTVVLTNEKVNDNNVKDEYEYGRFYIELSQEGTFSRYLKDQITVTATVGDKQISQTDILKTSENTPKGYVAKLTSESISLTVNYRLTEEAQTNFINYAEQTVKITLHWEFYEGPKIVNVYNKWNATSISYETKTAQGTLLQQGTLTLSLNSWTALEVDNSVTEIYFVKDSTSEPTIVSLQGITAKEVWVLYGENPDTVYTQNPDAY